MEQDNTFNWEYVQGLTKGRNLPYTIRFLESKRVEITVRLPNGTLFTHHVTDRDSVYVGRHNLVCVAIFGAPPTDSRENGNEPISLGTIAQLGDAKDRLTPDYIWFLTNLGEVVDDPSDADFVQVTEVKTRSREADFENTWNSIFTKYMAPLQERLIEAGLTGELRGLIVGFTKAYCSFRLTPEQLRVLSSCMMTWLTVIYDLKSQNYAPILEVNEAEVKIRLDNMLSRFGELPARHDYDNPMKISKEMFDFWKGVQITEETHLRNMHRLQMDGIKNWTEAKQPFDTKIIDDFIDKWKNGFRSKPLGHQTVDYISDITTRNDEKHLSPLCLLESMIEYDTALRPARGSDDMPVPPSWNAPMHLMRLVQEVAAVDPERFQAVNPFLLVKMADENVTFFQEEEYFKVLEGVELGVVPDLNGKKVIRSFQVSNLELGIPERERGKRDFHRSEVLLDGATNVSMGLSGWATSTCIKLFPHIINEHKINSQRPFHPDTYTGDLFRCLNESYYYKATRIPNIHTIRNGKLLDKALSTMQEMFPNMIMQSTVDLGRFMQTRIFNALSNLSIILQEVAVSQNHFTDAHEVVVKEIPFLPIRLLVAGKGSSKNVSFCYFWKTDCFKPMAPFDKTAESSPNSSSLWRSQFTSQGGDVATNNWGWECSDFITMNPEALGDIIGSEFKIAGLLCLLCQRKGITVGEFLDSVERGEMNMIITSILNKINYIFMTIIESKDATSQLQLAARPMYMQTICAQLDAAGRQTLPIKPLVQLEKMNPFPRSRLGVLTLKNFIYYFGQMTAKPPIFSSRLELMKLKELLEGNDPDVETFLERHTMDSFQGLLSWINGEELNTFGNAIFEFYLGVFIGKRSGETQKANFMILEKIVKREMIYLGQKKTYDNLKKHYETQEQKLIREKQQREMFNWGMKLPGYDEVMGDNEFDIHFIGGAVDYMHKHFLPRKFGDVTPEKAMMLIDNMIYDALGRARTEQVATYKASAVQPEGKFYKPKAKYNMRAKVMLQTMKTINEGKIDLNPFDKIDKIIEDLLKDPLWINIFNKEQHGGQREIIVMIFKGRIQQLYFETISRTICDILPNEMLTKGSEKKKTLLSHHKKAQKIKKHLNFTDAVTHVTSADATTWSQRFIMPVFGFFFTRLLPEKWAKTMCICFNIMADKVIEVARPVLDKFREFADELSFSDPLNFLKDAFNTGSEPTFMGKNQIFFKNVTNMGQGIMHYSSSSIHSVNLLYFTHLARQIVVQKSAKVGIKADLVSTTLVSSDDSAMFSTLIYSNKDLIDDDKSEIERLRRSIYTTKLSQFIHYARRAIYPMFCMLESTHKSAVANPWDQGEFNQEYVSLNSSEYADSKYMSSGIGVAEVTSIEDRLYDYANKRKNLAESGATHYSVAFQQGCQFHLHYFAMGSMINPVYETYVNRLLEKPVPQLGFFVLEPESVCGLLGHNFAAYINIKHSEQASGIENFYLTLGADYYSMTGRPSLKVMIYPGNNQSYYNFKFKMNQEYKKFKNVSTADWREDLNKDPLLIIREPRDTNELVLKIMNKSEAGGVLEAFSRAKPRAVFASAVYILNTPCVTKISKEFLSEEHMIKRKEKCSLIRTIDKTEVLDPLNDEQIRILFPMRDVFERVIKMIQDVKLLKGDARPPNYPKRSVVMRMAPGSIHSDMSLKRACQLIWDPEPWEEPLRAPALRSFELYQRILPWLNVEFKYTVEDSPFIDAIGLLNFLNSFDPKELSVRTAGSYFGQMHTIFDLVMKAMRNNYYSRHSMVTETEAGEYTDETYKAICQMMVARSSLIESAFIGQIDRLDCYLKVLDNSPRFNFFDVASVDLFLHSLSIKEQYMFLFKAFHQSPTMLADIFAESKVLQIAWFSDRSNLLRTEEEMSKMREEAKLLNRPELEKPKVYSRSEVQIRIRGVQIVGIADDDKVLALTLKKNDMQWLKRSIVVIQKTLREKRLKLGVQGNIDDLKNRGILRKEAVIYTYKKFDKISNLFKEYHFEYIVNSSVILKGIEPNFMYYRLSNNGGLSLSQRRPFQADFEFTFLNMNFTTFDFNFHPTDVDYLEGEGDSVQNCFIKYTQADYTDVDNYIYSVVESIKENQQNIDDMQEELSTAKKRKQNERVKRLDEQILTVKDEMAKDKQLKKWLRKAVVARMKHLSLLKTKDVFQIMEWKSFDKEKIKGQLDEMITRITREDKHPKLETQPVAEFDLDSFLMSTLDAVIPLFSQDEVGATNELEKFINEPMTQEEELEDILMDITPITSGQMSFLEGFQYTAENRPQRGREENDREFYLLGYHVFLDLFIFRLMEEDNALKLILLGQYDHLQNVEGYEHLVEFFKPEVKKVPVALNKPKRISYSKR